MSEKLIEVRNLSKTFSVRRGGRRHSTRAVDDVSFDILRGETLGLLGESGCGKTTLGRTITRLYEPTAGQIIYDGTDIAPLNRRQLKPWRRRIQTIFQDPYSALNPHMDAEHIIAEPLDLKERLPNAERRERILKMLDKVGLDAASLTKYPHEFSGGQRQRIGIARALITEPEFVLCDEPISALDVSIQAQVVNLLEDLQAQMCLTYLFVAHDLSMVRHISHRIAVMYLGNIVELAPADELYDHPVHPYTQALVSAIPVPDPVLARAAQRVTLSGDVPNLPEHRKGCAFAPRCPHVRQACLEGKPELKEIGPDHIAACVLAGSAIMRG